MTDSGFALFDTAIGRCGIAWNGRGIVAAQLPGADEARTRARLLRRCPQAREEAPPPAVRPVIDRIVALLAGEADDLSDVTLDMEGVPPFNRRVYEIARTIPPGQTLTYGEIAARLDAPDARAVGQALGENPFPPIVPCHRVVASGGKTGGFSATGGVDTKLRLLAIEGAQVGGSCPLFDQAGGEVLPMQLRPRRAAR
jgi:methylated-DNA-[protein]-cysteine S-methyltransferase